MSKTATFAGDPVGKQVQTHYQKLLDKLATKWDTDLTLCVCHGKYDSVPQEMSFDKLYIFVQLLPKDFEGVAKTSIKGYTINGKEIIFPIKEDAPQKCPQGDSLKYEAAPSEAHIITDDKGSTIAVIHEGAIYIMNDFIHCRSKEELDISVVIFNHIIKEAVDKSNLLNQLKSGIEEKSKRVLASTLKVQFSQRLEKELVQLKAARDTIIQYEKGITEAMRKVISGEKIVNAIKLNMADVPTALNKTWVALQRMNGSKLYSNVSFMKSGIVATTVPISIEHNKKSYFMGRFEVKLGFDGTTKIHNLDNRANSLDHPHVSDGNVCWGNFAGQIPKLIGSSEFDVALDMIYTFLCHYDSQSPYLPIEKWPQPKVKEEKKEVKITGMAEPTEQPTLTVRE